MRATFARRSGHDAFYVAFPVANRMALVAVDCYPLEKLDRAHTGLAFVAGKAPNANETTLVRPITPIGVERALEIEVAVDAKRQATIRAWLDGNSIVEWRGSVDDLSMRADLQTGPVDRIGLGTVGSSFEVRAIAIAERRVGVE